MRCTWFPLLTIFHSCIPLQSIHVLFHRYPFLFGIRNISIRNILRHSYEKLVIELFRVFTHVLCEKKYCKTNRTNAPDSKVLKTMNSGSFWKKKTVKWFSSLTIYNMSWSMYDVCQPTRCCSIHDKLLYILESQLSSVHSLWILDFEWIDWIVSPFLFPAIWFDSRENRMRL